jgi:hypothetical protein
MNERIDRFNRKEKNVLATLLYRGLPTSLLLMMSAFVQFYAVRAFA